MNNKGVAFLIALLSVGSMSLAVMDKTTLSKQIETTAKDLRSQLGRIENLKSTTPMRDLINELNAFVMSKADSDKDLLNPWATMKQSADVILTYIAVWSELSKQGRIDKTALKSNIDKLLIAIQNNKDAAKKIGKAFFVRSDKKEAAAMLKYFSEYLHQVGEAAHGALILKYNQTK